MISTCDIGKTYLSSNKITQASKGGGPTMGARQLGIIVLATVMSVTVSLAVSAIVKRSRRR
ncbi:MAG: hypothetical protein ACXVIG_08030 [Halobacteriota archaeon]